MAMPPADPTLYRFFEMIQVFGYPLKAIIHEKVFILVQKKKKVKKAKLCLVWGWYYVCY